jgi:tetratricopeptide (TPR) repeat protein
MLESATAGGPIAERLNELQEQIAAQNWSLAARTMGKLREPLRRLDPQLWERLVGQFYRKVVSEAHERALASMSRNLEGPSFDPHWRRAEARAAEIDDAEAEEVERLWRAYQAELSEIAAFSPAERRLADALIEERIGHAYMNDGAGLEMPIFAGDPDAAVDQAGLWERGAACFARAVEKAPEHREAHRLLAEAYQSLKQPQREFEAWRRTLERFPDDLDALRRLWAHHLDIDEPLAAVEYLERGRRLKPLDAEIAPVLANAYFAAARQYACRGEFDRARESFTAGDKAHPEFAGTLVAIASKAAFAMKAGQADDAQRLVEAARPFTSTTTQRRGSSCWPSRQAGMTCPPRRSIPCARRG